MTTIVKWSPFQELDVIERRLRRLLEDVGVAPAPLPAADLYETDGEFVVELEVPGFAESELSVEASDHTLCVTGERKEAKEEKGKAFRLHERLERRFERRFELPPEANLEAATATFDRGVLEVHVPKAETAKRHVVEIAKR